MKSGCRLIVVGVALGPKVLKPVQRRVRVVFRHPGILSKQDIIPIKKEIILPDSPEHD